MYPVILENSYGVAFALHRDEGGDIHVSYPPTEPISLLRSIPTCRIRNTNPWTGSWTALRINLEVKKDVYGMNSTMETFVSETSLELTPRNTD